MSQIYALVKNQVIENMIVADAAFIELIKAEWDACILIEDETRPYPCIGWTHIDGVLTAPVEPTPEDEEAP